MTELWVTEEVNPVSGTEFPFLPAAVAGLMMADLATT
jgi:hypothetical protein